MKVGVDELSQAYGLILAWADLIHKPEAQSFLSTHATAQVQSLMLKLPKVHGLSTDEVRWLVSQVAARQRVATKLPTWVQHSQVILPPTLNLEQCSSEATASYKANSWPWLQSLRPDVETSRWLDATLGLGVDATVMAQAGWQVKGIEPNAELAAIASHNAKQLGCQTMEVLVGVAEQLLSTAAANDVVYLDPDRRPDAQTRVVQVQDCLPDVTKLIPDLLDKGAHVVVKLSPMLDQAAALKSLPKPAEVMAISWKGDCRELVLAFAPGDVIATTERAVEILADGQVRAFASSTAAQQVELAKYIGRYVYDPGPALNKLHLADAAAAKLGLHKLHPNTWLYTSDTLEWAWPGRVYVLLAPPVTIDHKAVHEVIVSSTPAKDAKLMQAQAAVRNLELTAQDLMKKLMLKDGGDIMCFGVRLAAGLFAKDRAVLVCKRVRPEQG